MWERWFIRTNFLFPLLTPCLMKMRWHIWRPFGQSASNWKNLSVFKRKIILSHAECKFHLDHCHTYGGYRFLCVSGGKDTLSGVFAAYEIHHIHRLLGTVHRGHHSFPLPAIPE